MYENTVTSLYEACKPEIIGRKEVRLVAVFQYLRGVMESIVEKTDIEKAARRVSELLDESVVVDKPDDFVAAQKKSGYQIVQTWNLATIDFEKLKQDFRHAKYKNIEIADLQAFIREKIRQMLEKNVTRTAFAQKLQEIVDAYNAGASSTENYYDELVRLAKDLKEEEERHVQMGLTDDELEIYDLKEKCDNVIDLMLKNADSGQKWVA